MYIIIKEENGFMPDTIIEIYKIQIEENNKKKVLNYDREQIKKIMTFVLEISHNWQSKYIGKSIIDEDVYIIAIYGDTKGTIIKECYIKNKYPNNWSNFISFRNKLVREELKL